MAVSAMLLGGVCGSTGLFQVLRAVFTRRIDSLEEREQLDALGIELVFLPKVITNCCPLSNPIR